jgi:4-amino-4-deoxy-L-arabinose transferase-like glycosyltransferase
MVNATQAAKWPSTETYPPLRTHNPHKLFFLVLGFYPKAMLRKYSIGLERNTSLQYLLAFLCLLVYAGTFFFPLMDKDAAHHANIALRMYEHDDYADLLDRGNDYLDKPHFLFWASALSFKIFGVNTFAHRFPAFVFSLLSIYSTYKLARYLSDRTTAKLSAMILATGQAFVMSIMDARMETPLTAFIIFSAWQMIVYIDGRKFGNLFLAALGSALAFSTKGWVGPGIILITAFFHMILQRKWSVLFSGRTWLFIPIFFLFITPVLYAYYLQYDLHPEKIIRGERNRSGLRFILWDQLFERSQGFDQGRKGRNSDYFFLYHTFLWAFFPWSLAAYMALVFWFRRMFFQKKWKHPFNFAALSFAFILFTISFSKFKMPHYIIMLLPLAALFTAPWLQFVLSQKKYLRFFYVLHLVFAILVLIITIVLNYYFFQPQNIWMQIAGPLMIFGFILLLLKRFSNKALKVLCIGAGVSILVNFFLNYNFFPNLMKYQAGNGLAKMIREKNIAIPDQDILLFEDQAHSFDFYRGHNHQVIDSGYFLNRQPLADKFILLSGTQRKYLEERGFEVQPLVSHVDYNVTTVKFKFLNPQTREKTFDTLMLAKVVDKSN